MAEYDLDLFVIGGGSGGVRAGRLSAAMGKRVAIAEESRYGGTCVIRGCVPKKLYVYASQFPEHFEDAAGYGWSVGEAHFDWRRLVDNKEREITRLEGLYRKGLEKAGAQIFEERATLVDRHTVKVGSTTLTAETILIATGGRPKPHDALPGHEHCIVSDQAFDLERLPESIAILGGGYIAVEFANIFHGLGVKTTLVYRGQKILGGFDQDMRDGLQEAMVAKGIDVRCHEVFEDVTRRQDGRLDARLKSDEILTADQVMLAIGRTPNTTGLGLEAAGVAMGKKGEILVDAYSRTNVENIFAIGDVTDRLQLTPVAIHEAMCFVETAMRGNPAKADHETIATAVFSQPEIGTVGLNEEDACKKYDEVEIYKASFRPMRHTLSGRQEKMIMKLVVESSTRRVLGAHVLGPDAGEMAQLLAIPLKARLTKEDFDRTMAVHPTAAEELVTMYEPTYRIRNGEKVDREAA